MVKHKASPKTSSTLAATEALAAHGASQYFAGPTLDPAAYARGSWTDLTAPDERKFARRRKRLLCDLANMPEGPDGLRYFRRIGAHFRPETDEALLLAQASLRHAWQPKTPMRDIERIAREWFSAAISRRDTSPVVLSLQCGGIVLDPRNLGAQLALAIAEHWQAFRKCNNPDCKYEPYFLASRETQKYCSEVCTAYAQRQYAKAWWNDKGQKRRAARRQAEAHAKSRRRRVK